MDSGRGPLGASGRAPPRDGDRTPLRDGDWAVFRPCRGAAPAALEGRVVLVQLPTDTAGSRYQIKRLKRRGDGRWLLASDNPAGPTFEATDEMVAIARLERTVRPEDIAPAPGARLTPDELAAHFEVEHLHPRSGRYGGHLFVFVDEAPEAGGRVWAPALDRRPGETAFVLAADGDPAPAAGSAAGYGEPATRHRYLGVARWNEAEGGWILPG